jgi:hypothetical protein
VAATHKFVPRSAELIDKFDYLAAYYLSGD